MLVPVDSVIGPDEVNLEIDAQLDLKPQRRRGSAALYTVVSTITTERTDARTQIAWTLVPSANVTGADAQTEIERDILSVLAENDVAGLEEPLEGSTEYSLHVFRDLTDAEVTQLKATESIDDLGHPSKGLSLP